MKERRRVKLEHFFIEKISRFLLNERVLGIFITVTRVGVSSRGNILKIFVTVLPENKEKESMEKLKKSTGQLRSYLANVLGGRLVPEVRFVLDIGEKNRVKIDELIVKDHSSEKT